MGEWFENPSVVDRMSRVLSPQLGIGMGGNAHRQGIFGSLMGPAYCDLSPPVPNPSSTITKSNIQQDRSLSSYEEDTQTPTPTKSQASLQKSHQAILTRSIPNPNILAGGDRETIQKVFTTTTSRSTTKLSSSNYRKRIRADEKGEESSNLFKRTKGSDQSSAHEGPSARRGPPRKLEYACPFYRNNPSDPDLRENCRTHGINTDKLKEHIRRKHTRPAQCSRCGYRGEKGCIAKHEQRNTCLRSTNIKKVDAGTLEKDDKLREARGQSWHDIFGILFPDSPPLSEDDQWFHEEDEYDRRRLLGGLASFLERTFSELIKSFRDSDEFKRIKNPNIESIMQASLNPVVEATRLMGALSAKFSGFNPSPSTTQNSESTPGSANPGSTSTPDSTTPDSPTALSSEVTPSHTSIAYIAATTGDSLYDSGIRGINRGKSRAEEDLNAPFRFQTQENAGSTSVGLGSDGTGKELQTCSYVIPGRGYQNSGARASSSKRSIASSSESPDCSNQTRDPLAETVPTMTIKNKINMASVGKEVVEPAGSETTNEEAWETHCIQLYETHLAAAGEEFDPYSMFQFYLESFRRGL